MTCDHDWCQQASGHEGPPTSGSDQRSRGAADHDVGPALGVVGRPVAAQVGRQDPPADVLVQRRQVVAVGVDL